jgi:DNA polymerase III subunit delta
MSYQNEAKAIQKGQIKPVYVLYGLEQFLIDEFVRFVKVAVLGDKISEFTFSSYDLQEVTLEQVVEDARTPSFWGEKKLVVANHALFLTGGKKADDTLAESFAKKKKAAADKNDVLISYLEEPSLDSVLVFVVNQEKLDERKKIVKLLQEKEAILLFSPLKGRELWEWMDKRSRKFNVKLDHEAAAFIEDSQGTDLGLIASELQKMATYVGKGGTITKEVVELLGSRTLEQKIFELVNHVTELRIDRAMQVFDDLLKNKEHPLKILSVLTHQFRLILFVKILVAKGYSHQQILPIVGAKRPFQIKRAEEQSRKMKEKALRAILAYLADEDYNMKTGKIDPRLSLELFISRVPDFLQNG